VASYRTRDEKLKVALITTWPPEMCGIAQNAVNIVAYKQPDVEYKIIDGSVYSGKPVTYQRILDESVGCDLVHLSYERNIHRGIPPEAFQACRLRGQKSVITYHNVWPGDHQDDAILNVFDVVVSQDPASPAERGFVYIPQGVVSTVVRPGCEMKLGTAGFLNPMKGAWVMAGVAAQLGLGVLVFAPRCQHSYNVEGLRSLLQSTVRNFEIVEEFLTQEQVACRLSECAVTTWLYQAHGAQSGISGSARLGLAARRPMVVSRCGMYRDLWYEGKYDDEIYFLESDSPTVANVLPVVQEALEGKKRPNKIVWDMSWVKAGEKYAEVYRGLMQ
jgi:hypothetical protein